MNWIEQLPDKCPPNDAMNPNGLTFYRLTKTSPITEKDLHSQRRLQPNKSFEIEECIVCSLSIWQNVDNCIELLKLPLHKKKLIVKFVLHSNDGLVLKTFGPNHYSWWATDSFNISAVQLVEQ